jgi:hypothetical protein
MNSNTSTTAALDTEYEKVFPTKVDKVQGRSCTTCAKPLVFGSTYTATNDYRQWDNYCLDCASSTAAQIKALFARLLATGAEVPAEVQDKVRLFLTAESKVTFVGAKEALITLVAVADREARVASLLDVEEYNGLALFVQYCGPKDKNFSTSLLQQWEAKGALSAKQMTYVVKFAKRGFEMATAAEPDPDVEPSLYIDATGNVYRIYRRSHRLFCRAYNGTVFVNDTLGVKRVAKGLADGSMRLLTGDEARAYGRQHKRCFNCLAMGRPGELSDDRSIAAGYGERCASVHGWYYPTAEEAAAILRP